jgi:hypothetical protein
MNIDHRGHESYLFFDGTFLKSRPAILMNHKMELLNADGEVVETRYRCSEKDLESVVTT